MTDRRRRPCRRTVWTNPVSQSCCPGNPVKPPSRIGAPADLWLRPQDETSPWRMSPRVKSNVRQALVMIRVSPPSSHRGASLVPPLRSVRCSVPPATLASSTGLPDISAFVRVCRSGSRRWRGRKALSGGKGAGKRRLLFRGALFFRVVQQQLPSHYGHIGTKQPAAARDGPRTDRKPRGPADLCRVPAPLRRSWMVGPRRREYLYRNLFPRIRIVCLRARCRAWRRSRG